MRQLCLLAAALALSGMAEPKAPARFELWFGATPTSPIGAPVPCAVPEPGHELCHRPEPDYVPNYETAVPKAIQSCGASFVGFREMTEGKTAATFDVDPAQAGAIVRCIKQRLPQGFIPSS